MSIDRVTLKQLKALVAVARSGTIAGAAKHLYLSAPAVSLTLRQLGEVIEMPVLERREGVFFPTDAGKSLIDVANRIEDAFRDCDNALFALKGLGAGSVRVGVVSTAKYFAPFLLAAFRSRHPQIDLVLRVGNREETVAELEDFSLDLAVMGRPPQRIEVELKPIGPHPHVIIAAPDHALAGRSSLPLTALAAETFLLREPGSGTRNLCENLLAGMNAQPRIGMEMSSNETIKQSVMAGLGVALISAHTVANEIADGRLAVLDVQGTPVMRQWYAVRRRQKPLMPAVQVLWNFIIEVGQSFLPDMALPTARQPAIQNPEID